MSAKSDPGSGQNEEQQEGEAAGMAGRCEPPGCDLACLIDHSNQTSPPRPATRERATHKVPDDAQKPGPEKVELEARVDDERHAGGTDERVAGITPSPGLGAEEDGFVPLGAEVFEQPGQGAGDAVDFGKKVFCLISWVLAWWLGLCGYRRDRGVKREE